MPLFFMEAAYGQFASLSPISVWRMIPLCKGYYCLLHPALSWHSCLLVVPVNVLDLYLQRCCTQCLDTFILIFIGAQ